LILLKGFPACDLSFNKYRLKAFVLNVILSLPF